jgi:hypothetical protein
MSLLLGTILPAHTDAIMTKANALTMADQETKA